MDKMLRALLVYSAKGPWYVSVVKRLPKRGAFNQ